MSSGGRVSISNSVRKMIQNIKEITGNSDEEIHATLKECCMDPNETAQKLLLQDPFHEVKRKRDRRKENLNKESTESRWKPAMQGRGSRGGRGNSSSRYDAVGGRNSASGKENGSSQVSEEGHRLSTMPTSQDMKNKEATSVASSSTVISDHTGGINQSGVNADADIRKLEGPLPLTPPVESNKIPTIDFGTGDTHGQLIPSSSNISASRTSSAPSSGVYFSDSDPVLVPSQDSRLPSVVGTIRREVGSQRPPVEQISATPAESKSAAASSEVGSSFVQGKTPSKSQGVGKNQPSDSSQPVLSAHGSSSVSRPSSNYSNRSQVIGPQKVGPSKEWKPKPTNPNLSQGSGTVVSSEVPVIPAEARTLSQPALYALDSKEAISELERKLDESHISDSQHVIIPNHLHVPEAEKLGFCFGSFDASFGLNASYTSGPESDKSPLSENSEGIAESVDEQSSSNQIALASSGEGDYPDCPPSSSHVPENLSSTEGDVSSSVLPEYRESKQETALLPGGHQYSAVHSSPNYSFGFIPPILGSQLAPIESTESQARDISRLPSFVVQQPFDPTSYYAQFYRPGADNDGRISPFHSPGVATKYNGNVAVLPPQASQSSQEGGNSLLLSTAGPTPPATQAAGVMQSPIAVSQQPLPVFRQPAGVHLPHFHPNYIPYAHYYSPFYVPPPAIHQILSNGAFPQQPQAGSVYPSPPVATTKYSLSQYKPGSNIGNSTHIGNYGPYGSSPASYNPSSAATTGNSTSNEDIAGSQFKESNVYITGQQSEGSGVWIAAPGRDVSGLQASSFYNLPQGQVAFTPTQAGHGTFAGIYHHPAQPVTATTVHPLLQQSQTMAGPPVDMVGPTASVYQQPQPAQINWPNNY